MGSIKAKRPVGGKRLLRLIVLILTLFIVIYVWIAREQLQSLSRFGYAGIFLINLLASSTVVFPVPGVASVFLGGALFNPILVGFASGTGAAIGELTGYFMGYGGRGFVSDHKLKRIEGYFHRAGFISILFFASIPFPFDLMGIIAGSLNYPVWKFVLATMLGRIGRNFVIAWTGARVLPI